MSFSEKIFLEAVSCEGTILPACERCPIFGGGGSGLFPKPIGEKTFVKPLDRRETACYNIKAVLSGEKIYRGVEQLVARRAHNPKVVGSSPASATRFSGRFYCRPLFS